MPTNKDIVIKDLESQFDKIEVNRYGVIIWDQWKNHDTIESFVLYVEEILSHYDIMYTLLERRNMKLPDQAGYYLLIIKLEERIIHVEKESAGDLLKKIYDCVSFQSGDMVIIRHDRFKFVYANDFREAVENKLKEITGRSFTSLGDPHIGYFQGGKQWQGTFVCRPVRS
jgi:hypothetical protein